MKRILEHGMARDTKTRCIEDQVVDCVDQLPVLPGHIVELRRVIADPNVNFRQIIPILNKDPGLTADMLKRVNSARFGLRERVGTVEQAILFFGMRNFIEYIAVTFAENSLRKTFSHMADIHVYFQHATEISLQTRNVAGMAGMSQREQDTLMLAGLLHDVGRLVLQLVTQRDGTRVLSARPGADMETTILNEQERWGIDHCVIGARICRKWRFPEIFESCIRWHHKPVDDGVLRTESAIVYLAHILTVPGITPRMMASALPEGCLEALGLNVDDLMSLARKRVRE